MVSFRIALGIGCADLCGRRQRLEALWPASDVEELAGHIIDDGIGACKNVYLTITNSSVGTSRRAETIWFWHSGTAGENPRVVSPRCVVWCLGF